MREFSEERAKPPWWLAVYFLLAIAASYGWSLWAYSRAHLEGQGIDIVHHAVLVHEVGRAEGPRASVLGEHQTYPMLSHRMAAWALPLFGNDPLLTLRFAAMVAILWTYGLQLGLLRRFLSWPGALLVLAGLQIGLVYFKIGILNHTMGEGQYNYSRLVSGLGFWASLYLLSFSPLEVKSRLILWVSALSAAGFAFLCHLAPGIPTLVALAALGICLSLESRSWRPLFASFATLLLGGALLLFSGAWEYMAENATATGWLPVRRPLALFAVWLTVAAVAGGRWLYRVVNKPSDDSSLSFERVMSAGLLGAGALQAWIGYRLWRTSGGDYAFKSLFTLTITPALFLVVFWVHRIWKDRTGETVQPFWGRHRAVVWGLALALPAYHISSVGRLDLGLRTQVRVALEVETQRWQYVSPAPQYLPISVANRLVHQPRNVGACYLDPLQPFGSYYVNLVAMELDRDICKNLLQSTVAGKIGPNLEETSREVVVPLSCDPAALGLKNYSIQPGPEFLHCRPRHSHLPPILTVGRVVRDSSSSALGEPE